MNQLAEQHKGFDHRLIEDDYLRGVLRGEAYLLFDGAMGTMLQNAGLAAGALPELLNLENPAVVTDVHKAYVAAGSQVVTTNTFGASAYKLEGKASVDEVFKAAIACAKQSNARYVAADIGPIGTLMSPLGTLSFDEAYLLFKEQMISAASYGADIILIETMTDVLEAKAAILAAKENTRLPIFATMTFEGDGRTFLGTSPKVAALTFSALGVAALGINCSLGPLELAPLAEEMLSVSSCPVMVQANAGLPDTSTEVAGQARYNIGAEEYAQAVEGMLAKGVSIVGGCCGTSPAHIEGLARMLVGKSPIRPLKEKAFSLTSAQNAVVLASNSRDIAVIGERINPTGKPRLKEALRSENYDYLIEEAVSQQEFGADILDVNVGLPELDEVQVLATTVQRIQAISSLPLQIDSSDPRAIEAAVRIYAGKPLINSVNGKEESLNAILPLAKHYGCAVLGLTLDEEGIPETAQQRFAIAEKIVERAEDLGISREDVAIDCLVMAASTNQKEILEILKAVRLVKQQLGVKVVLGVSNVSFGLPERELINASFLAAAFGAGLDLPILNPASERYRDVVASYRVLNAQDENAQSFIEHYAQKLDSPKGKLKGDSPETGYFLRNRAASGTTKAKEKKNSPSSLNDAENQVSFKAGAQGEEGTSDSLESLVTGFIETGRKAPMREASERLLEEHTPLSVIEEVFIPALNVVGDRFAAGTLFLPQLMASAEAVKVGFDVIRSKASENDAVADKGKICLATVKGDVHDIGKNIVKMILENYGYRIYDLGRDVAPEKVLEAVEKHNISLVGLSALMTTTVKAMEETIKLLRDKAPTVKVVVGGAVLSPEYAKLVGADFYAKDAIATARIAEDFFGHAL